MTSQFVVFNISKPFYDEMENQFGIDLKPLRSDTTIGDLSSKFQEWFAFVNLRRKCWKRVSLITRALPNIYNVQEKVVTW